MTSFMKGSLDDDYVSRLSHRRRGWKIRIDGCLVPGTSESIWGGLVPLKHLGFVYYTMSRIAAMKLLIDASGTVFIYHELKSKINVEMASLNLFC